MESSQQCPSCKRTITVDSTLCTNCNYPFKGTDKEKAVHIASFISKKNVVIDAETALKNSKKILFFVAAMFVFSFLLSWISGSFNLLLAIFYGFLFSIFVLCAVFLRKNPVLFSAIPLVVLLSLYSFEYFLDTNTFFSGIFIKVLLIGSLIYGIYLNKKAVRFKKRFQN